MNPRSCSYLIKNISKFKEIQEELLLKLSKCLAPKLSEDKHKGQAGRIGVIGGSLEYTGAPYFSAITALRVGADLSHVFCTKEAAPVIKSYSPELIVHPLLDSENAVTEIEPWLERLHVIVIGPGLGRNSQTLDTVSELINLCRRLKKPLVIDADGLFLISKKPELLHGYPNVILSPNANEFNYLVCSDDGNITEESMKRTVEMFGDRCTILRKGKEDEVFSLSNYGKISVSGSSRRCGGQGDVLSGSLAVFYNWALENKSIEDDMKAFVACYAACRLTRLCNKKAFGEGGRSMLCTDMIKHIGSVFCTEFEADEN